MIGPAIEGAIDHVLIDEYQDVNGLQVEIVLGLRRSLVSLFPKELMHAVGVEVELRVVADDAAWAGSMCNVIAFRLHLRPGGDEMLLHRTSRPMHAEAGGAAARSGALVRTLEGAGGQLTA